MPAVRAAGAAARRGSSAEPTIGGPARRGRELPPVSAKEKAHKLPTDRDPDTIKDAEVRQHYIARLQALDEGDQSDATGRERKAASDAAGGPEGLTPRQYARKLGAVKPAESAGGVFLGMLAAALVINYLQGGTEQLGKWFRAKFLNDVGGRPAAGGKVSAAKPSAPAKPSDSSPSSAGLLEQLGAGIILGPLGPLESGIGSIL